MMQYRDDRSQSEIEPRDWAHIEEGLVCSYSLLKQALEEGKFAP